MKKKMEGKKYGYKKIKRKRGEKKNDVVWENMKKMKISSRRRGGEEGKEEASE